MDDLSELVRKGRSEGLDDDSIRTQLYRKFKHDEVEAALGTKELPPEKPKKTRHWILLLLLLTASIPLIFESEVSLVLLIGAFALYLKALFYGLVLYMIMLIRSSHHTYKDCFYASLIISTATLIPVPVARFLVTLAVAVIVLVLMLDLQIQAAVSFMIFMLLCEFLFSFGVGIVAERVSSPDSRISVVVQDDYCDTLLRGNYSAKETIRTSSGKKSDYCTEDRISKRKIESCSGASCYLVEYSCIMFKEFSQLITCPDGCSDGACMTRETRET
jgi:hypothetical protein